MTDSDRRDFLKKSAAAAAGLGVAGCAADEASNSGRAAADRGSGPAAGGDAPRSEVAAAARAAIDRRTLRAIGEAVLPVGDLGPDGIDRVVDGFARWLEGFEPAAEIPHAYLNRGLSRIRYGPPDPAPRWAAQVEALRLEAGKRFDTSFTELDVGTRRSMIEGQLGRNDLGTLGAAAAARHIAVGLLAYFYGTPEATDLCYGARIGRYECRGLDTLGDEPEPLEPA